MDEKSDYTREVRDGREVLVHPDGHVKDAQTGHFLHPPNGAKITTSERGKELSRRAREIETVAKIRAYAKRKGIDLSQASDEELVSAAGDTLEAVHDKALELYFEAKTPRGAEGMYPRLSTLRTDTDKTDAGTIHNVNLFPFPAEVIPALIDLGRRLKARDDSPESKMTQQILDGTFEPSEE
jgi:hypothetical protein